MKSAMSVGRPREFDVDKALDQAMLVFWKKGYEGASLLELTQAMGINRPSLYAAFGNKEALFRKALDRYAEGPGRHVREAFLLPTAREVVEQFLRGSVELITRSGSLRGCMIVQSAMACGDSSDPSRREMAKRRASIQKALRERFEQAIIDGDLPKETDAEDLARYVATISNGLSVQASGGASRDALMRVVDRVMQAWPS